MIAATCATIASILAAAQPGDVIRLSDTATCDRVSWPLKMFDPPVTVLAHDTTVKGLRVYRGGGVIWRGGTIRAPAGAFGAGVLGYGIHGQMARNIEIHDVTVTDALKGLVFTSNSEGLIVSNSKFEKLGGDGINIASSRNVLIDRVTIRNFLSNGSYHQDGIQMWNASTDILIRNSIIEGNMMGITDFGATGQPGTPRITVENNRILVDSWTGISLQKSPESVVRYNMVGAPPGASKRPNLRMADDTQACGNNLWNYTNHRGEIPCGMEGKVEITGHPLQVATPVGGIPGVFF